MAVFNTRSSRYFILESSQHCSQCSRLTHVFGVALPAGHETLDPVESDDFMVGSDDPNFKGLDPTDFREWLFRPDPLEWVTKEEPVLIPCINAASTHVSETLQAFAKGLRYKVLAHGSRWSNYCEHCEARLADDFLYGTPGNAFYPADKVTVAGVLVRPIDTPFEATCGPDLIYGSCSNNQYLLEKIDAFEHNK